MQTKPRIAMFVECKFMLLDWEQSLDFPNRVALQLVAVPLLRYPAEVLAAGAPGSLAAATCWPPSGGIARPGDRLGPDDIGVSRVDGRASRQSRPRRALGL